MNLHFYLRRCTKKNHQKNHRCSVLCGEMWRNLTVFEEGV
nr:MAG TPA: HMG (high mobility group) box 5 [Caudoviricetes sp.]